jgi:scyllo-inositol 2-dehydrogenase (NADP+)
VRAVVIGLGIQGRKRRAVAGPEAVATVDPVHPDADYKSIADIDPASYDAALVCVPDGAKIELLRRLLGDGKHVLVEKPLVTPDTNELRDLAELARAKRLVCYTAYNHRFEPHFARMREILASGRLGRIYRIRMFYGNGTARDVRASEWRDQGAGVLPDLGSHLLDTIHFWLGAPRHPFAVREAHCFENHAFDHVVIYSDGPPAIELEMTLLAWRNHFTADILAELGTAHIESLCKWGPTTLTVRSRVLPSGRPPEESTTLVKPDPTWQLEYDDFKRRCAAARSTDEPESNIAHDVWINDTLASLAARAQRAL